MKSCTNLSRSVGSRCQFWRCSSSLDSHMPFKHRSTIKIIVVEILPHSNEMIIDLSVERLMFQGAW